MKKTFIVTALVLAAVAVSSGAWARPSIGGGFYSMGPVFNDMTLDEQAQVLSLQKAHEENVAPIREQFFKKRTELRGLTFSRNADKGEINALEHEVLDLMEQLRNESVRLRTETMKVVAPVPAN